MTNLQNVHNAAPPRRCDDDWPAGLIKAIMAGMEFIMRSLIRIFKHLLWRPQPRKGYS
jgi:hypothetical protein